MSTPDAGGAQPPQDPRVAFAELSKIMLGEQPLSATLTRVAELARQTIPGAAAVSVTLVRDDEVESAAFTGPIAAQLDERQYEAGFGPCMDAATSGGTITINDTAHSETYPDFARAARRQGVTHSMSVGLPAQRQIIGGLNIYGTGDGTFDEQAQELATAFASYAAVAVANAGLYASTAQLAAHLQQALASRAVIDQALGIVMAQRRCTADEAFDTLRTVSQNSNVKVRDVAARLVASVSGQPAPTAARFTQGPGSKPPSA